MKYSEKALEDFRREIVNVARAYDELATGYLTHTYKTAKGKEYAHHGLLRRLSTMQVCIQAIFRLCPPDRDLALEKADRIEATIHVQAFVLNVYGALDNLAWIWVNEKDVRLENGNSLTPHQIGLHPRAEFTFKSLSDALKEYISSIEAWFSHIKDFRDALAHRIPLYIPPHMVDPRNAAEYSRLEELMFASGNAAEYENLKEQQAALTHFVPMMKHTVYDDKPGVLFHSQVICDWLTVCEIAKKILKDL